MTRSIRSAIFAAVAALSLAGAAMAADVYKVPRNGYGQPDLSGTWTNASVTQLERPAQFKALVMTPDQAKAMERASIAAASSVDSKPSDPKAGAPSKGEDPGGYNAFWIDPGPRPARSRASTAAPGSPSPPTGGCRGAPRDAGCS